MINYPVVATMTTPEKNTRQRSSLLNKMLVEDKYESRDLKPPKTKEIILEGNSYSTFGPNWTIEHPEKVASSNGVNYSKDKLRLVLSRSFPERKGEVEDC